MRFGFIVLLLAARLSWSQLNTGILRGSIADENGQSQQGISITITGKPGSKFTIRTDAAGEFELALPYGEYRLSTELGALDVYVSPPRTTRVRFVTGKPPSLEIEKPDYPESYSLNGLLLALDPATVSYPLDFSGLASMRLPLFSQRAFSWTDVRYTLQGVNATDPYQPGRTVVFPDVQAISDVVVKQGPDLAASRAYGSEIGLFIRQPDRAWRGALSTSDTGSFLASDNLPLLASRGSVQQSERFNSYTRDNLQVTGSLGRRVDLLLSGTGQWASQTVPQAHPDESLDSRLLFGNARGRVRIDDKNQLNAQFSGSRINLSGWGNPVGLEALIGRSMSPSFTNPNGFQTLKETDHLDHLQVGWTRPALEVRYGFSTSHLDTRPAAAFTGPSQIELMDGAVTGPPPLANMAVRTRQNLQVAFQPREFTFGGVRHLFVAGGGWEFAKIRNRVAPPANSNLITANGVPEFAVDLNTPLDSRERIQSFSPYAQDRIALKPWLAADLAIVADISRGSVPSQSSPAGSFAPARSFVGQSGLIAWNSASPRAGIAITPPKVERLTVRANYARLDSPIAGRYLDYGNPNSLSGLEYSVSGQVLRRFGGLYSQIDARLKRPYADEFNVGAEIALPLRTSAGMRLFRRDEKDRIAAMNIGVPASAYSPVRIVDPGPDSMPGTFDDQVLTVYAQDPATFGKDQFLLTNPPGLRMQYEGMVAEATGQWRFVQTHASFVAIRSRGPANPGDSVLANDPGVIGALLQDPNAAIHAAGRDYFDRGYVGKLQMVARLPKQLGGIEWANTIVYLDGLAFARQLLVSGLPQGPFLVATTVRGSPEGGNRAEYALNWNFRLSRGFELSHGGIRLSLDIFNVINGANRLQENDLSGPLFNQRLPIAIEPARYLRFNVQYQF